MPRLFKSGGGPVTYQSGSHKIWSDDQLPVNRLPASDWITVAGFNLVFPTFDVRTHYGYVEGSDASQPGGGITGDACMTVGSFPAQEWGPNGKIPGRTFDVNLPEIVLGTVPAGVNDLDVRLTMSRTKAPSNYRQLAVPNAWPAGEVCLDGGSASFEEIGPWRRGIWIGLDGTNVVLWRFQSVNEPEPGQYPGTWVTANGAHGWSRHGGAGSDKPNFAFQIDSRSGIGGWQINVGVGPRRRNNGGNSCSMSTAAFDFSSIYTGTIVIRPGYRR
jgi:hypothetical protein